MAGLLNFLFLGCLLQEDPPKPTLSPSTLRVKEGTSVSLSCSAPAPCLSHPPTLTWTPRLGDIQETLLENENKTKDMTSSLTFTASHLHHGQEISCTAICKKRDGSIEYSVWTNLTADISFVPQILPSSGCTRTADQLDCSCEAVGNPFPTLQWYLDGSPVHHLDGFVVSNEPLNETGVRSFITVNQPQKRDISVLLCRSSNPLGSAAQQICVYCFKPEIFSEGQDCSGRVTVPVFTVTVSMLTAALVCALLFAISAHGTCYHRSTKSEWTDDESTAVMSEDLTSEKGNKVSITSEEDIYVNTNIIMSDEPNTHQQHVSKNSKRKNEEGSDVTYSSLIWKSKSKKKRGERSGNRNPSGSSFLEEEKCMEGSRNYVSNALEMGSLYGNILTGNDEKSIQEYGQVKFRDRD